MGASVVLLLIRKTTLVLDERQGGLFAHVIC
jgi:hypothetical protein